MKNKNVYILSGVLLASVLVLSAVFINTSDAQGRFSFFRTDPTKGEIVDTMMRDAGHSITSCSGSMFTDVPSSHRYCDAIEAAVNAGYVTAYPDGTFLPNNVLSRAEAAKFAQEIYELADYSPATPTFDDIGGYWFEDAVEAVYGAGGLGIDSGDFRPSDVMKRVPLRYWTNHL